MGNSSKIACLSPEANLGTLSLVKLWKLQDLFNVSTRGSAVEASQVLQCASVQVRLGMFEFLRQLRQPPKQAEEPQTAIPGNSTGKLAARLASTEKNIYKSRNEAAAAESNRKRSAWFKEQKASRAIAAAARERKNLAAAQDTEPKNS